MCLGWAAWRDSQTCWTVLVHVLFSWSLKLCPLAAVNLIGCPDPFENFEGLGGPAEASCLISVPGKHCPGPGSAPMGWRLCGWIFRLLMPPFLLYCWADPKAKVPYNMSAWHELSPIGSSLLREVTCEQCPCQGECLQWPIEQSLQEKHLARKPEEMGLWSFSF